MAHPRFGDIGACVFDAYGTLFDYNAAASRHGAALGDKAAPLAELWRLKQLQYTWLRSLMGRYAGFWQVTGDALDYAMAALDIEDEELRAGLMDAYRTLDAYPEVPETLATLRAHGLKTAILSNGEPSMLDAAGRRRGSARASMPSSRWTRSGSTSPTPRSTDWRSTGSACRRPA